MDLRSANIAVIEVTGVIMESLPIIEQIRDVRDSENIKAIVVRIDSPGGAVGASQEIFMALKKQAEAMPMAVSMGNLAASGGLYVSLAGDRVFSLPGTLTGSMGVMTEILNVSKLLDKAYLKPVTIRSGELKDAGNPTKPMDAKAQKFLQDMINRTFYQFREHVKQNRDVSEENLKLMSDGRVIDGSQAVELGIAHEIGTFEDAVEYVKAEAGIKDESLAFVSRKPKGLVDKILEGSARSIQQWIPLKPAGLYYISDVAYQFSTARSE